MPGRFEGMSDAEWELFEEIFPEKARKGRGMPAAHPRKVLNSPLFILMTGCRRLKAWHSDGRLKALQAPLLGAARNEGLICWKSGAAGGSFSLRKRRRRGCCAWICKAKACSVHLLADAEGMPLPACSAPADEDERKHAGRLIETAAVKTGKAGRPRKNVRRPAADKGYGADALRNFLKKKGIQPQIPRKRNAGREKKRGRPMRVSAPRFQAGRTFSWLQKKFRRLAIRWERLPDCFDAFLSLALCFIRVQRLAG